MAFRAENAIFSDEMHTLGLCSKPHPAYLNPTKCFEPSSSAYTQPCKLWLVSETSIGDAGGHPKMAVGLKVHKKRAQLHQMGILGPMYQPPTNIFEPNQVFSTNV